MKQTNLTEVDKARLNRLIPFSPHSTLTALSSQYCEDDEVDFKDTFGMTFKQALAALSKLKAFVSGN